MTFNIIAMWVGKSTTAILCRYIQYNASIVNKPEVLHKCFFNLLYCGLGKTDQPSDRRQHSNSLPLDILNPNVYILFQKALLSMLNLVSSCFVFAAALTKYTNEQFMIVLYIWWDQI